MSRDLDSASACDIAHIDFLPAGDHDFPIVIFATQDALGCAIASKLYVGSIDGANNSNVRMECQELHRLDKMTAGTLYLLEGAAYLRDHRCWPISILALVATNDITKVRWFWTVRSPSALLAYLEATGCTSAPNAVDAGTRRHKQLYTLLTMLYDKATSIPDSADFKRAEQITDYAPAIIDPENALSRLEGNKFLHFTGKANRDLSDDRYLHHLHPAERELANITGMKCSEYLLVKRQYFRSFLKEVATNKDKIRVAIRHDTFQQAAAEAASGHTRTCAQVNTEQGNMNSTRGPEASTSGQLVQSDAGRPTRVRTDNAHIQHIERLCGYTRKNARLLIEGWKQLGFLQEDNLLQLVDLLGNS